MSELKLLKQLVINNSIGIPAGKTVRCGDWKEVIIAIGNDEVAYITLTKEALDVLDKVEL